MEVLWNEPWGCCTLREDLHAVYVCHSRQLARALLFLASRLRALMIPAFGQGSNQWRSGSELEHVVWVVFSGFVSSDDFSKKLFTNFRSSSILFNFVSLFIY